MDDRTLIEKYEELVQRYNSMCEAAVKNQEELGRLATENARLAADLARTGAELEATQKHVQLLGEDYNSRSQSSNKEIIAMRERMRECGLDPDVGVQ